MQARTQKFKGTTLINLKKRNNSKPKSDYPFTQAHTCLHKSVTFDKTTSPHHTGLKNIFGGGHIDFAKIGSPANKASTNTRTHSELPKNPTNLKVGKGVNVWDALSIHDAYKYNKEQE